MARRFRINEMVRHGSGANLDNLASVAGGFTWWEWAFRFTTDFGFLMSKRDGSNGWNGFFETGTGLQFSVFRATTNADTLSSTTFAADIWHFVSGSYNNAASPTIRMFAGGLSAAVAEVSYSTQVSGSGTPVADATANLTVGNVDAGFDAFLDGMVQRGGIIRGTALTAAQLEAIRVATLISGSLLPTSAAMLAAAGHELAFDYQAGSVADLTGNGHNGSVTGATASELLLPLNLVTLNQLVSTSGQRRRPKQFAPGHAW